MLITLALITYTALMERNYSFSKLCGSFQQRPTLQTEQPVGIGLSDAQRLLPEHGNSEFLAKPLHMCVQENRKFRQSISTASKAGSAAPATAAPGAAGMERGCSPWVSHTSI